MRKAQHFLSANAKEPALRKGQSAFEYLLLAAAVIVIVVIVAVVLRGLGSQGSVAVFSAKDKLLCAGYEPTIISSETFILDPQNVVYSVIILEGTGLSSSDHPTVLFNFVGLPSRAVTLECDDSGKCLGSLEQEGNFSGVTGAGTFQSIKLLGCGEKGQTPFLPPECELHEECESHSLECLGIASCDGNTAHYRISSTETCQEQCIGNQCYFCTPICPSETITDCDGLGQICENGLCVDPPPECEVNEDCDLNLLDCEEIAYCDGNIAHYRTATTENCQEECFEGECQDCTPICPEKTITDCGIEQICTSGQCVTPDCFIDDDCGTTETTSCSDPYCSDTITRVYYTEGTCPNVCVENNCIPCEPVCTENTETCAETEICENGECRVRTCDEMCGAGDDISSRWEGGCCSFTHDPDYAKIGASDCPTSGFLSSPYCYCCMDGHCASCENCNNCMPDCLPLGKFCCAKEGFMGSTIYDSEECCEDAHCPETQFCNSDYVCEQLPCGDGDCKPWEEEDCLNCPIDCLDKAYCCEKGTAGSPYYESEDCCVDAHCSSTQYCDTLYDWICKSRPNLQMSSDCSKIGSGQFRINNAGPGNAVGTIMIYGTPYDLSGNPKSTVTYILTFYDTNPFTPGIYPYDLGSGGFACVSATCSKIILEIDPTNLITETNEGDNTHTCFPS